MQELGEGEEENINVIPEGKYKELIQRFPELLKPNFQTETPKVLLNQASAYRPVPKIFLNVLRSPELNQIGS